MSCYRQTWNAPQIIYESTCLQPLKKLSQACSDCECHAWKAKITSMGNYTHVLWRCALYMKVQMVYLHVHAPTTTNPKPMGGKSLTSWSHNAGATYQTIMDLYCIVRNFWGRKLSWIPRMKFCRATPTYRYDWFGIPQEFLCEMLASYWSAKVFSLKRFPLYMIVEHAPTGLIPSCMYYTRLGFTGCTSTTCTCNELLNLPPLVLKARQRT